MENKTCEVMCFHNLALIPAAIMKIKSVSAQFKKAN